MKELKTFEEWGVGNAPIGYDSDSMGAMSRAIATSVADYADFEEKKITEAYPWLLRPIVRWVRRATKF